MDLEMLTRAADRLYVALEVAGQTLTAKEIRLECWSPPHQQPASQPGGRPAVYAFFYKGQCLKCGQVGPNSAVRYTSQHYNPRSSNSNLAATLLARGEEVGISQTDEAGIGEWIKVNTCRINVLFPTSTSKATLNFAEAFFHVLWSPRFEGREWRDWLSIP